MTKFIFMMMLYGLLFIQNGMAQYTLLAKSINNGGITTCIPNNIYRHHITIGNVIGGVQNIGTYSHSTAFVYVASPFIPMDTTCMILPIEMILDAYIIQYTAHLTWNLNVLEDVKEFNIQRSAEGLNFANIKQIPVNGSKSYIFEDTDAFLQRDTWFYRIELTDINGGHTYSNTIELNRKGNIQTYTILYPNPVTDKFKLAYLSPEESEVSCSLYNISGQKIDSWEVEVEKGENLLEKDIKHISAGIYLLKINRNASIVVVRIVKL